MRRTLPVLTALLLILSACGGGDGSDTTTSSATTTTRPSTTSQDSTTPPESSSSTDPAATDTQFAITGIDFENDLIEITNIGSGAADIGGWWLCQRPSYFQIPGTLIEPGETHVLDGGVVDGLDSTSGEVGLYLTNDFGSSSQIVSYVEWGTAGHGRSSVAVGAGIWSDGEFVSTEEATTAITTGGVRAIDPADWSTPSASSSGYSY